MLKPRRWPKAASAPRHSSAARIAANRRETVAILDELRDQRTDASELRMTERDGRTRLGHQRTCAVAQSFGNADAAVAEALRALIDGFQEFRFVEWNFGKEQDERNRRCVI